MIFRPLDGSGLTYVISVLSGKISEKFNALAKVAKSGSYTDLTNRPSIPSVINSLTNTSTRDALAVAQGKVLNDKITELNKNINVQLSIKNVNTDGHIPVLI